MEDAAKPRPALVPTSSLKPLHSVILEQQAALEELESVLEHLPPFRRNPEGSQPATNSQSPGAATARSSISKRELQVLTLMVDGKTSTEIAAQLGISF